MKTGYKSIKIIKWFGFLVLLLVVVNMIISAVTNKANIDRTTAVTSMEKWAFHDADGHRKDINVPCSMNVPKGQHYSISSVIPDVDMAANTMIFINAIQTDVEVWIGDEKRLSFLGKDMSIPLINAPTRYLFVPVTRDDIGKTITIEFMSMTRHSGRVPGIAIATESSIWMKEMASHGISFMFCIFGIVVAITTFASSFMTFGTFNGKSLRYLSIAGLTMSLWLFCEHRLNQLLFSEPLITGLFTYIFVILLPIPLIMFFNTVEGKRHEKLFNIEVAVVFTEFIVLTLLQFFTNISYSITLPVHYGLTVLVTASAVIIIIKDCIDPEKHIKSYMYSAVGIIVLGVTSIIEIICLVTRDFYVIGAFIIPGLIITVFSTTLQQAKDSIEESEKKRRLQEEATINTIRIIAGAIDARDEYTGGHSSRVAYYASTLIKEMGYSDQDVNDVYYVGLLHDIGKIGIPDSILNKSGKLTSDEYHLMKFHSVIGAELLSKMDTDERLIQGIRSHHERYDGTGYPDGLKGEEIPKIARILCIADSYDAMTSNRVYRHRLTAEQVEAEIMKNAGTQFDPELARIFCNLISTGVISPSTYDGFEASEDGKLSKAAVIQRMITQPVDFAGANEVNRPEFMRMLMYILKIAEKNNTDTCVLLFTLKVHGDIELSKDEIIRGVGMLANAMSQTSRRTDVVTQYSETQRVVALIGTSGRDYKVLADDTIRIFNEMDSARKYDVDYRVIDWKNEQL